MRFRITGTGRTFGHRSGRSAARQLGDPRGRRRQRSQGGGAGGVPFPTLAGMVGRYRADLGIFLGAGSEVIAWADQSPAGNDLSAPAIANRPLWVSTGFNGGAQPFVRFRGVNDFLQNLAFINFAASWPALSFWWIAQCAAGGTYAGQYNAAYPYFDRVGAGQIRMQLLGGTVTPTTSILASPQLLWHRWDGATMTTGVGGGVAQDTLANAPPPEASPGTMTLGATSGGALPMELDVAEWVIQAAAFDPQEQIGMSLYANDRYGVPL